MASKTPIWNVGDLVTAMSYDLVDPAAEPAPSVTGIVVGVENKSGSQQMSLFPLVSVYDFKTRSVRRIYSYNLKVLSIKS